MNIVSYAVVQEDKKSGIVAVGGHGYTYAHDQVGKKKVVKNVATQYGYHVGNRYQINAVDIISFLNIRTIKYNHVYTAFLSHIETLFTYALENNAKRILIVANAPKSAKAFAGNKPHPDVDVNYHNKVFTLYEQLKDKVIFDYELYPKGGTGVQAAANQNKLALLLTDLIDVPRTQLDVLSKKEYLEPTVDFNKLVSGNRWFFNTGDVGEYYKETRNNKRCYYFGHIDPKKGYYGKATPDVYYSALFTKEPITIFDKLYEYSKANKSNKLNYLLAGNLNNILSKEIVRSLDVLPGVFDGNRLVSPIESTMKDEHCLVEVLFPVGISYRIKNHLATIDNIYDYFIRKEDNKYGVTHFVDITDRILDATSGGVKLNPNFTSTTLKFPITIQSPDCNNPVKINLSVKYDIPERNNLNALIKDKVKDIKVWLGLDFKDKAGVSYFTLIETAEFDYVHINSCSNLHVYSLKELGKQD